VVLDDEAFSALTEKSVSQDHRGILTTIIDAFYAFTREPQWQKKIPATWKPLTFHILEEPFRMQNGTLNCAKKMVRERIIRSCQKILESMYTAEEDTPLSEANLETISRLTQKILGVKV
jgi:hypothetical protein